MHGISLHWRSAVRGVPAFVAGGTVLLFLLAALLPLSAFVALVMLHVAVTLTLVLPKTPSPSARALLLCDHVSELSFLLFALAVSLSLDPASDWQQELSSVLRALVTLTALVGVVVPKMQLLRMTLFSASSPVTLRSALALLSAAVIVILLSPFLLQRSLPQILVTILEQLTTRSL